MKRSRKTCSFFVFSLGKSKVVVLVKLCGMRDLRELYDGGRFDLLPSTFSEITKQLSKEELARHEFENL